MSLKIEPVIKKGAQTRGWADISCRIATIGIKAGYNPL